MSEITIILTEQQEKFLKMFAANHGPNSEDNVGTRKPFHVVQTRRERVVDTDYDSPDIIKYYVPDESEDYDSAEEMIRAYWEHQECPVKIVPFGEAQYNSDFVDVEGEQQYVDNEEEYIEAYGIPKDHYYKTAMEYHYEPVAVFFILAEAERYMEYQKHNLCHPRTYTYSPGYANYGDYEHFWDLLYGMGVKLNDK